MSERLYSDLARWWPLLAPPGDYTDEAAVHTAIVASASDEAATSWLELGAGGASLACHLGAGLDVVLVDRSPEMLAVCADVAPTFSRVQADMRTLDLSRRFDVVRLHDAVMYLTSPADLRDTYATAFAHLRPGGLFLVLPDVTKSQR